MATTVDELQILIRAETKGIRGELKKLNKGLGKTQKATKGVGLGIGTMAKAFATVGFAKLAGSIVNTARTFEDLEATLKAVTMSAEGAALSMQVIERFTAGTTFQLDSVAKSFVTLVNAGITPTSDVLTDFGNIAAAFNKDLTQMAQAVFNATTGEMEMLKQFGVKAKLEGEKIEMIFREKKTVIGRNSDEIVGYLRTIAQENYATALESRLDTVSGSFSNLKDMVSLVFKAIGEAGLNEALTKTTKKLISMVQGGIAPAAKVGHVFGVVIEGLSAVFTTLMKVLGFVITHFKVLISVWVGMNVGKFVTAANSMVAVYTRMKKAIQATTAASIMLQAVTLGPAGIAKVGAGIAAAGVSFGLITVAMDKFLESTNEATEGIDYASMSTLELDEELKKLTDTLVSEVDPALDGTKGALGDMQDAVVQSSNAFTKDFVDSLLEGENALESFKNFAKNIVSQIIAIFLQMEIVNKILNHVFSLTGTNALPTSNFMSGMFGGSAGVSSTVDHGGVISTRHLSGMSGGGTIQSGMPTLVGERGPEIFMPNTGGTIMNNMNTKNAMGGGTVVVNQSVNFSTGVVPTVRAEVMKMLPAISEVTKSAVLESTVRGGSFGKAIRGAS